MESLPISYIKLRRALKSSINIMFNQQTRSLALEVFYYSAAAYILFYYILPASLFVGRFVAAAVFMVFLIVSFRSIKKFTLLASGTLKTLAEELLRVSPQIKLPLNLPKFSSPINKIKLT